MTTSTAVNVQNNPYFRLPDVGPYHLPTVRLAAAQRHWESLDSLTRYKLEGIADRLAHVSGASYGTAKEAMLRLELACGYTFCARQGWEELIALYKPGYTHLGGDTIPPRMGSCAPLSGAIELLKKEKREVVAEILHQALDNIFRNWIPDSFKAQKMSVGVCLDFKLEPFIFLDYPGSENLELGEAEYEHEHGLKRYKLVEADEKFVVFPKSLSY